MRRGTGPVVAFRYFGGARNGWPIPGDRDASVCYNPRYNEMSALARSVDTHKALAHPVRQRLVAMLREGELCVCQMTVVLELAASTVSAHLADLKRAGLFAESKKGRFVSYGWSPDPAAAAQLAGVAAPLP